MSRFGFKKNPIEKFDRSSEKSLHRFFCKKKRDLGEEMILLFNDRLAIPGTFRLELSHEDCMIVHKINTKI